MNLKIFGKEKKSVTDLIDAGSEGVIGDKVLVCDWGGEGSRTWHVMGSGWLACWLFREIPVRNLGAAHKWLGLVVYFC